MLSKETLKTINKNITNEANIEQLAKNLQRDLNNIEIKKLKTKLEIDTLEVNEQIKDIIELLNKKGLKPFTPILIKKADILKSERH